MKTLILAAFLVMLSTGAHAGKSCDAGVNLEGLKTKLMQIVDSDGDAKQKKTQYDTTIKGADKACAILLGDLYEKNVDLKDPDFEIGMLVNDINPPMCKMGSHF